MNEVPDDVLRLIFQAHVHDLKCSPAGLLTVNRRWHAVSLDTRNLWARITISIDSFDVIPYITGFEGGGERKRNDVNEGGEDSPSPPCPLQSYLNRSCSLDGDNQYPLDIRVVWYPHQGYISPPESKLNRYPTLNQYDKSYIPYFTAEDGDVCSLQMQILVHFLCGITVHLEPSVLSEIEQVQEDQEWDLRYRMMEKSEKKLYIMWLEKALRSIQTLSCEELSASSSKYCSISLVRNEATRWRSVELDLYQISGSMDISIPVTTSAILQRGVLASLESIELRGVSFSTPEISNQSLRHLELKQSSYRSSNDLGKLEVLILEEGALKSNSHFLSQMHVQNLHNLRLLDPLEMGRRWRIMAKLASIFTESHPLTSLMLCPKLMGDTVNIFIQYPNFRIRELHISSQYLGPLDMNGDISSQIIAETRYLLREMKSRGIQVYPADMRTSKALELAAAGGEVEDD